MKRTESNEPEDVLRQQRTAPRRCFSVLWIVMVGAGSLAIGFLAGISVDRFSAGRAVGWLRPGEDATGAEGGELTPQLVEQYREELIRLTERRNDDAAAQREKQLTLQILQSRGFDVDSPLARRLAGEVSELQAAMAATDDRLASLREQLAKLTAVKSAAEHQQRGLNVQTEVDARRIVLEHDAGLLPSE